VRKLVLLFTLICCSALFGGESVMAQSLEGQWLNVGQYAQGDYALTVYFAGNGALQYQMAIRAAPGTGGTSGMTLCQGNYQFDGQTLMSRLSCQNGMPAQLGGPVQFQDENTVSISGDIFRRQ
jgi:hypothetical protein